MGIEYLTSEEIRERKDSLQKKHGTKPSEFLLSGIAEECFRKYLPDKEAHILDLGCGTGDELKELAGLGYRELWGLDIDNYLVYPEFSDRLLIADLNRECIPLPDGDVDALVAFNILEHLENPFHFARECVRVTRRGGVLLLSVPNGNTIMDKLSFLFFGKLLAYRSKNNHITFLLDTVFAKAFRDFEIVEMQYGNPWIPWLRPRRWNKKLPKHPLLSYNKLYVLQRTK